MLLPVSGILYHVASIIIRVLSSPISGVYTIRKALYSHISASAIPANPPHAARAGRFYDNVYTRQADYVSAPGHWPGFAPCFSIDSGGFVV